MVARVIVLMIMALSATAQAAVQVDLARRTVPISDSFTVTFIVDGQPRRPDFSALAADFDVLGTSQSSSMKIENGQMTSTTSWTVELMARRIGELIIPPIVFGAQRSGPVAVTITATDTQAAAAAEREIFMEVEADPAAPYVQAQIRFTVRIFRSVSMSEAALTEPEIFQGEALIERIGEDITYETARGGARYSVIERRYAIFPQSSGGLVIGPMTLNAVVGATSRSFFDPRTRGRRLRVQSETMEFDVSAIPDTFPGRSWLPAERVQLTEQWPAASSAEEWRVGEPRTRTLTLLARGLSSSQLAQIDGSLPAGIKQYTDQPELEQRAADGNLVAMRRETVALIPSQTGRFELPEIVLPWWNTTEDRLEFARVPARTVTVLPALGAAGESDAGQTLGVSEQQGEADAGANAATLRGAQRPSLFWVVLSSVLAAGWLITALLFLRSRRGNTQSAKHGDKSMRPKAIIAAIKQGCDANDKDAAAQALLRWAATQWPGSPVRSLGELAARVDGALQAQVHQLSRARYAANADSWTGNPLWAAFDAQRHTKSLRSKPDAPQLEPLYRKTI